jgi:hypothetical protein
MNTNTKTKTNRIEEIKKYLEARLYDTMEWYRDCVSCEETYDNIRRDVKSILKETTTKFGLEELPFHIRLDVEDGGKIIVLKAIDKSLN